MPESNPPSNAELTAALKARDEQVGALEKENKLLREKIDLLVKKLFGSKSERLDAGQLLFLLQELEGAPPKAPEPVGVEAPRRSKVPSPPSSRTPRIPEHLPVLEEIIEPAPVKACPDAWRRIGEEVSERLDYEPARFFKRRTVRPKYVQRADLDAAPVIAKLPGCILEGSIATPGLLAQIITAKYCDHNPLYRQQWIYRSRYGVELTRQHMSELVAVGAQWLRLIAKEIHVGVISKGYVQIDETPIRYQSPGTGKTGTGYFWAMCQPTGDVHFHWETSRAAACLEKIVPVDFTGVIQRDGYAAYESFARRRGERITMAGCWTHVRRKFHEALGQAPKQAALVLHVMQNLYDTERRLRQTRAGPKLRALARSIESRPVIQRLRCLLIAWKTKRHFLPQSLMGKAIEYLLGQWDSLLHYLADGRVEIDTNLVENAIRPTALGKKNWMFVGRAHTGERSAIIYTVIESCRRRGIDPYAYLRDVFTRLPNATTSDIKDLTPEAWATAQRNATLKRTA